MGYRVGGSVMVFRGLRWLGLLPALWVTALAGYLPVAAQAQAGLRLAANAAAPAEDPDNARVIVKYRTGSSLARDAAGRPRHAARLGRQLALTMQDGHVLGQRTQGLRARGLTSSALATRLALNPEVEWVVVDRQRAIRATGASAAPNDPYFGPDQTTITPVVGQWYLRAPDTTIVSAINAVGAWAITTGVPTVTVAVLDTGVRFEHPDLLRADQGGKLWPGHDFVRESSSGDGDGIDADASDPGNGFKTGCTTKASVWHGTEVAGLIGALTDNGIGMASVGRKVMVLPVRVLGDCGSGYDSDIIAGMRWAAGLSSTPVPNPHPAQVINLSLGGSGACSAGYRDAINEVVAARVAVVVAAGNGLGRAVDEPGNCPGAIAVAAVRHAGTKVGFSSLGPEVAIAAPGGNCVNLSGPCLYPILTTTNTGTSGPGASTYSSSSDSSLGTSFSTPLVAGTIGLMLSVDPTLSPAQIKAALQSSVRQFPPPSLDSSVLACLAPGSFDQVECHCTTTTCGAGLLDAGAAVSQVYQGTLAPSAVITASSTTPTVGDSVTLSASNSAASSGRTVTGIQWAITSGAGLASFTGATSGSTATLATRGAGTVVVQLTVTDSVGAARSSSQSISVAAVVVVTAPAAGGGGGAAPGLGWMAGLATAVLVLAALPRRQRERSTRGAGRITGG